MLFSLSYNLSEAKSTFPKYMCYNTMLFKNL